MKRFSFVEKDLVDCGDYTLYPIEVTGASMAAKLDKIAEIYYRVKHAQFTANDLISDPTTGSGVTGGTITQRIVAVSDGGVGDLSTHMSGYWTLDDLGLPCDAHAIAYLTAQYSVTLPASIPTSTLPVDFRDIASNENGMWLKPVGATSPAWNYPSDFLGMGVRSYTGSGDEYGIDEYNFKTGFSWYSISCAGTASPPSIPIPYIFQIFPAEEEEAEDEIIYEELEILVEFNGEVAWVGTHLLDSATRFFLGVRFTSYFFAGAGYAQSWGSLGTEVAYSYVIRLSSGDLSCPLITNIPGVVTGDIIHEAVEWWPYAKWNGMAAVPVWDEDTGLLL
jgi:hypothetical protein